MSKRVNLLFKKLFYIAFVYKPFPIGTLVVILILKDVNKFFEQTVTNYSFNFKQLSSLYLLFKYSHSACVWEVLTYIAG